MDLADIMLRGLDQGAGVASRAMSFTQQAEQLRRLRELDRYQQEQDALNYGLRQADDARADQRFAFDQEQAGLRNQQYAQQEQRFQQGQQQEQAAQRFNTGRYIQANGPIGDSNFFQAADFSQMDPRMQAAVLPTREQQQAEEEKARKGQAWNLMQNRRKSRGGPTPDALVDMWEESQVAQDAGVPDYAWRETMRVREAQAQAAEQAAALPAQIERVSREKGWTPQRAADFIQNRRDDFVNQASPGKDLGPRGVPLSQDRDYARLKLVLDDAEDELKSLERQYNDTFDPRKQAELGVTINETRKAAKAARRAMMDHLSGGGQPAPGAPAPSPTSAVAPAADPIESVLTELEQRLGRPPTEEEAWQALNGGG